MSRPSSLAVAIVLAVLLGAAPAEAQLPESIRGAPAPGPSRFDRVTVTKAGPSRARTVLVMVPGTAGGAGDFTLLARDLVRRVGGVQVWAMDRRTQALEDTSVFAAALAGRTTPQAALDYYVGWLADPARTPRFAPPDPQDVAFAREWGLRVQVEDLRRVVRAAGRGGRRVLLGGHSLGASVAVAYATWDFGGRPGHRDLDGLVLVDGGLLGTFDDVADVAEARRRLAEVREQPFLDLLGLGLPWAAGVLAETAAVAARMDPTGPSILQAFPLLPAAFTPPVPATNRGALGYAFDASTAPDALRLIQVRAGRLGSDGDWVDGEVSPIDRVARTFAQEPVNAVEWFFPRRLTLDVDAASQPVRSPVTRLLGLRTWHLRTVDTPLYALQTSLTDGRVARGARRLRRRSRIREATIVDASRTTSHLDPLTAAPDRNPLVRTLVPWLRERRR